MGVQPGSSRSVLMAFHLDPLDPRSWSGTAKQLADGLMAQGWRVDGRRLEIGPGMVTFLRRVHGRLRMGPDWVRNPALRRLRAVVLARRLREADPTVVFHIGTLHLPMVPGTGRRQRHVMFIDATWSQWARHRSDMGAYPGWFRTVAEYDERRAYAQMDHFFTTSEATRRSLVEEYGVEPDRVTAVGTGLGQVLPSVEAPPADPSPRLLLVAKHRHTDKGVDIAVAALALVRRRHPDAVLTLVGTLPAGIEPGPGVEVRPWVEADELARLYAAADLFVLPARNEPWGLVYLEALSQGTPILGVDRHSFREMAGDGRFGLIVDEPLPDLVADAILSALDDRGALAEMGRAGRRHVEAVADWGKVAKSINDVLEVLSA